MSVIGGGKGVRGKKHGRPGPDGGSSEGEYDITVGNWFEYVCTHPWRAGDAPASKNLTRMVGDQAAAYIIYKGWRASRKTTVDHCFGMCGAAFSKQIALDHDSYKAKSKEEQEKDVRQRISCIITALCDNKRFIRHLTKPNINVR